MRLVNTFCMRMSLFWQLSILSNWLIEASNTNFEVVDWSIKHKFHYRYRSLINGLRCWKILVPHPKSQLCLQLAHVMSCGWWRGDVGSMWRHPSTNHKSLMWLVVEKVVVLGVTPELFLRCFWSFLHWQLVDKVVVLSVAPELHLRCFWSFLRMPLILGWDFKCGEIQLKHIFKQMYCV